MDIHITNQPGGIIQQTDKPIINNFGHTTEEEIKITQSVIQESSSLPDKCRLSMYIKDPAVCSKLEKELAACTKTAEVRLAVANLNNGKILSKYRNTDFASALLPWLNFKTTASAVYQALLKYDKPDKTDETDKSDKV